jgi:hypothetical protein
MPRKTQEITEPVEFMALSLNQSEFPKVQIFQAE